MATDAANLATIKSNLLAKLATESANPKPSYSINGQSVSWSEWRKSILDEVAQINVLQSEIDGAYEIHSLGVTDVA